MTALALMNMIPMPFTQFERRNRIPDLKDSDAMRLVRNLLNQTSAPTFSETSQESRTPRMDFGDGFFSTSDEYRGINIDWSALADFFS